jgi:hypothetical protein
MKCCRKGANARERGDASKVVGVCLIAGTRFWNFHYRLTAVAWIPEEHRAMFSWVKQYRVGLY